MQSWRHILASIATAKAAKKEQAMRACKALASKAALVREIETGAAATAMKEAVGIAAPTTTLTPTPEEKSLAAATRACTHRSVVQSIKHRSAVWPKAVEASAAVPTPEARQLACATRACIHKTVLREINSRPRRQHQLSAAATATMPAPEDRQLANAVKAYRHRQLMKQIKQAVAQRSILDEIRSKVPVCTDSAGHAVPPNDTHTSMPLPATPLQDLRCGMSEPVKLGTVLPEAPVVEGMHGPGVVQLQLQLVSMKVLSEAAIKWRYGTFDRATSAAIKKLHACQRHVHAAWKPYKEGTFTARTAQLMLGRICIQEASQQIRLRRCMGGGGGGGGDGSSAAAAAELRCLASAKRAYVHKKTVQQLRRGGVELKRTSTPALFSPTTAEEKQLELASKRCLNKKLMTQIQTVHDCGAASAASTSMLGTTIGAHDAVLNEFRCERAPLRMVHFPADTAGCSSTDGADNEEGAENAADDANVASVAGAAGNAGGTAAVAVATSLSPATAADDDLQAALCVAWSLHLEALSVMGFADISVNIPLLMRHKGNVLEVVSELVQAAGF